MIYLQHLFIYSQYPQTNATVEFSYLYYFYFIMVFKLTT